MNAELNRNDFNRRLKANKLSQLRMSVVGIDYSRQKQMNVHTTSFCRPPRDAGVVNTRTLVAVGGQTDAAGRLEFVVVQSCSRRRRRTVVGDAAQEIS